MKLTKSNIITLISLALIVVAMLGYTLMTVTSSKSSVQFQTSAGKALIATTEEETYADLDGNPLSLKDYLGQVIVANSWASWSPFSKDELVTLSKIAEENEDIAVLAINRAETRYVTEAFLKHIGETNKIIHVLDPTDKFYESINGYAMPETVIYDTNGQILHHNRGPMSSEQINLYIELARTVLD